MIQPILGDNVDVYPNAVIFGGIRIGNNVKIGAGAVVNKDGMKMGKSLRYK